MNDHLKVAVLGWLRRGTGYDGMLTGLVNFVASRTGSRTVVIPQGEGAEVALASPHLVEPAHVQLAEYAE